MPGDTTGGPVTKRWVLPVFGVVLALLVIYVIAGTQVRHTLGGPDWAAMCSEARATGVSLTGTYETICRDLDQAQNR